MPHVPASFGGGTTIPRPANDVLPHCTEVLHGRGPHTTACALLLIIDHIATFTPFFSASQQQSTPHLAGEGPGTLTGDKLPGKPVTHSTMCNFHALLSVSTDEVPKGLNESARLLQQV